MSSDKLISTIEEIVISTYTDSLDNIVSIVLVGGYSRNEGAFITTNKGIFPVNDIDFYIVVKGSRNSKKENELSQMCSTRVRKVINLPNLRLKNQATFFNFSKDFFIDTHVISLNKLQKVPPLVRFWEMKENGKVIWGKDIRSKISINSPNQIPKGEGLRFLSNQLTTLFRIALHNDYDSPEALYFIHRTRATFATALLNLHGNLKPSYMQRAQELKYLFKEHPNLNNLFPNLDEIVLESTKYKINPKNEHITYEYARNLHEQTTDIGLRILTYYVEVWSNTTNYKEGLRKISKTYYGEYLTKNRFLQYLVSISASFYLNILLFMKVKNPSIFKHPFTSPDFILWYKIPHLIKNMYSSEYKDKINNYLILFDKVKKIREL